MTQETKKCRYPKCYSCEYDYCMKDDQISLKPLKKDRTEYYKKYYQEHKEQQAAYYREYYKSHKVVKTSNFSYKVNYVRYSDVLSTVKKLRKAIGKQNAELILKELDNIEKLKYQK